MKKLFYLAFLLPLLLCVSCGDDNDIAEVDVIMQFSGVTLANGTLYTVQGETVTIDDTSVSSLTSENAIIQRVEYFLDGVLILPDAENNFKASFDTSNLKTGEYAVVMKGLVLQVDKSVTAIRTVVPLIIVESSDDLPEEAPVIGTYKLTLSTTNQ